MELNSFGSRAAAFFFMHYYVRLAKKAINWHGSKKKRSLVKEISSFIFDGQKDQKQMAQQLCVHSHLFVLSRFQAPHMDRCFPFHSSEL